MNRSRYYEYIAEKIEILSYRIKSNGKLNLLHLNIHSETLYRDFLNILYDYNLEPTNIGAANYEAIDLIDTSKKLVVQVTSTATTTKVNNTLKKEKIKELSSQGYHIHFIFIADEAKTLRTKSFENEHGISFDPRTDILDKITILEAVSQSRIEKLMLLHDLMQKEFSEQPSPAKVSSNLATVVTILAKENLGTTNTNIQLNDYSIEEKIDFNELGEIKVSTFDEYKTYYGILDKIYEEFIREGTNKTVSVFRKITSLYEKELISKSSNNIEKIFNIIEKVEEYVLQSDVLNDIPDEEIDMCVKIIVVDAFVRCKIFKNPRGYSHVAP